MKLKYSNPKPWMLIAAEKVWQSTTRFFLGVFLYTLLIIFLYTLLIILFGERLYRAGTFSMIQAAITENVSLVPKMARGLLSEPEHLTIDIKQKDFMKLAQKRQVALANGILLASPDDYVPAKIRHKDQTIDVKLRLKGDLSDHWEGDKWSFRVIVKGDNTLFGMKQFSLQHPKTRGYIYEWLYHQALKREGVASLRYEFIDVTVNGKDWGVYALEEHFEKRLIEHNQLREGPIVRFNEDLFWANFSRQTHLPAWEGRLTGSGTYLSSDIDAFQTTKWLSDPASYSQYVKAVQLLESFRRGTLKTSEVFDVQKLAKLFAISELLGATHGAWEWINARFYYNPITSRLEPIGFDGNHLEPRHITSLIITQALPYEDEVTRYIATFFEDRQFYEQYIKELERISEPSYLDNLLAELKGEMGKNLNILYREFPHLHFSQDVFYQNQEYIRLALNPVKGLHAYYHQALKNKVALELANIQYLPIEVLSVSYKDSLLFQPTEETILPGRDPFQPVEYRDVTFTLPEGIVWSDAMMPDLKVNYKILGTSRLRSETVFPWSHLDAHFVEQDLIRQEPNVHKLNFLVVDESAKKIYIKPGSWDLGQSLMIPTGYRVMCGGGTRLNLSNSAKIISYSPLEWGGNEDNPIIIESRDSTGQGIVVLNAAQMSVLEYVTFDNLSNPSQSGWELTGAVNFYESPVTISRCQFLNNRSEDALNIIRSEFTIDSTLFRQAFSDAFDGDFTKGKITRSSFVACGNDGIDVSGSVIDIQDVFIGGGRDSGDKGLSVGENSRVTVNHIDIKNAEIAVASKDLSELTMKNVNISDSKVGFAVYQKKPEFGSATIQAEGLKVRNIEIPYLIEERSTMVVDGEVVQSSRKNVKEILYGVEYGKSSK